MPGDLQPLPPLDDALDPAGLLRWYADAGVGVLVEEEARNFFEISAALALEREAARKERLEASRGDPRGAPPFPSPPASAPQAARGRTSGAGFGGAATPVAPARRDAVHLATAADTLEALKIALDSFVTCPLRKTATNTVFADGNPASGVMIIGEAPGADEDRLGLPFVGVSGKLLDRMLASIGLDRRTCYITNVVPWRPPGNRKPTADEIALCVPFLERHIALVDPRAILAVGGLSAQTLLARTEGVTRLRGKWGEYAHPDLPRPAPVLATFHPAYLLRTPEQKRLAWRDLLAFQRKLDETRTVP